MTDSQRVLLVAGRSGAVVPTAAKYLRGEHVKGAHLRERLAEAVRWVEELARQQDGAPSASSNAAHA